MAYYKNEDEDKSNVNGPVTTGPQSSTLNVGPSSRFSGITDYIKANQAPKSSTGGISGNGGAPTDVNPPPKQEDPFEGLPEYDSEGKNRLGQTLNPIESPRNTLKPPQDLKTGGYWFGEDDAPDGGINDPDWGWVDAGITPEVQPFKPIDQNPQMKLPDIPSNNRMSHKEWREYNRKK